MTLVLDTHTHTHTLVSTPIEDYYIKITKRGHLCLIDTHTHTCANTYIGKHTHIHDTHTHDTHTHKHSHACAHTHTHTRTHTHTHTHTHSCKHSQSKEKYEMFGHAQYLSKKSRSFVPALSSRFFGQV